MGSIAIEDVEQQLQQFHVTATGHSLNYLPEYIAQRHGFFCAQGLDVTVSIPQPWDRVLDDLSDGSAEAALGGIWVPSMYHGRSCNYTAFAQVANRAPLAILARKGYSQPFQLSNTVDRTILMKGSNGASVGLFFKMLLRENGIDPNAANYIQDLDGAMLSKLFVGGMGDYLVIDNLSARALVSKYPSDIHIALEAVTDSGDIPWSVYYRKTSTITPGVLGAQERFCVALAQGMDWVLAHDAEEFADELQEIFPKASKETLVELTNVFRKNRMWTSPVVDRSGFRRWQKGIADGHLVEHPLEYKTLVDDGPSLKALASIKNSALVAESV
jgi:NitT/TauT family transport system substrate-binding protein